jgi:glycosyltransferase involved in cell wall biosynthesis
MANSKVTIAIPTYNRSQLLRTSLTSALQQDYADYQVVVLDNASSDDTEDVVRSFADARVTYLKNDENLGLFRNWNRAIEINRSPYLSILQDDDVILPGFVRESVNALETHVTAAFSVVRGAAIDIDDGLIDASAKDTSDPLPEGLISGFEFLHRIVKGHKWITHFSTVMMRSESLAACGPFDHPHSKDTLDINLFYRLAARFDIVFINKVLCQVRFHPGQESQLHYDSEISTGPAAVIAERVDAIAYLMRSSRAADPSYREWLAERLLFLSLCRSLETQRLVPSINYSWEQMFSFAQHDIRQLIPPGYSFILVDGNEWGADIAPGSKAIPFLERDGVFWGSPPDDETAIRELERLRSAGARFIVFVWPAFWWFDYYIGLRDYLISNFSCVLRNSRLFAFDLRT